MIECPRCGCKGYHAYDIGPACYAGGVADFPSDRDLNLYYFGVLTICNYCSFEHIILSLSLKFITSVINGASMGVAGHDTVGAVLS